MDVNLIISLVLLIMTNSACVQQTSDIDVGNTQDTEYEIRKNNAIWCYYESNFNKNSVVTIEKGALQVDTNICFINDGLMIDTTYIADILEFTINAIYLPRKTTCLPFRGIAMNVFGFYPDADTVCYRYNWDMAGIDRKLGFDHELIIPWLNNKPMSEQKALFKEFIVENKEKINNWLRKEAQKRGYIEKVFAKLD